MCEYFGFDCVHSGCFGIFFTYFFWVLRIKSQSENAIEGLVFFDIQIGSSIIYFKFVWLFIAVLLYFCLRRRFFYICSHSIPLLLEFQHKLKLESCFFRSFAFVTLDCCKQCHDEKKIHQLFFWFAWKKIPALIDFLMNNTKKNIFNAK